MRIASQFVFVAILLCLTVGNANADPVEYLWEFVAGIPTAVSIAAQGDGGAWAVTSDGGFFQYSSDFFTWMAVEPPTQVSDVGAAPDASMFILGADGSTWMYYYGGWTEVFPTFGVVTKIAVAPLQILSVIDSSSEVTLYQSGGVEDNGQGPSQVTLLDSLNQWGLNSTGGVIQYNPDSNTWSITRSDIILTQIHVSLDPSGNKQFVGVDATGNGYYSTDAINWSIFQPPYFGTTFQKVQATANGIWALLTTGEIYYGFAN